MNLPHKVYFSPVLSIPRVSGDEPALNLVNLVFFQYSPRERDEPSLDQVLGGVSAYSPRERG